MSIKQGPAVKLCIAAVFTAITAVLSQVMLPMPGGVPITLQTLAVALCGYFSGAGLSSISIVVYILLGLCGVPVFSGFGGGPAVLLGPTGGFIFGFIPLCVLCGAGSGFKSIASKLCAGAAGLILCHSCGIIQFCLVTGSAPVAAIAAASLPYIPKDLVCVAAACLLSMRIKRALR